MDKRGRAGLLRQRLQEAMLLGGISRSELARRAGTDRSTISQLLAPESTRLPNAQVVAECARALGASTDWLLGLSDRMTSGPALLDPGTTMPEAPRALIDETLFGWHRNAEGQKIRHVPAHLPDLLKTEAFLTWEYRPALGRTIDQAIGAAADRLAWLQSGRADYDLALPLHEIIAMAGSAGYYGDLPTALARQQIRHMAALARQLFPRYRIAVYDGRRLHSAPLTVFGRQIAVLYLGQNYLTFSDTERVQALSDHVDALVRTAVVSDRDVPSWLEGL